MKTVEIRDLDGPNIFLLRPAIKLEIALDPGETPRISTLAEAFVVGESVEAPVLVEADIDRVLTLLAEVVNVLHDQSGADRPEIVTRAMETPGHYVVAWTWQLRKFSKDLAHIAYDLVTGAIDQADLDVRIGALQHHQSRPVGPDDMPAYAKDSERRVPIIGITGTNGKTTTTRLISAIFMNAGYTVGWTSTAGVFIQGEERISGDYTGPSGASYVLKDPEIDVAVLETARGGMLLRGVGYQSCDIGVVTNVSPDHLGLHGVLTIDGLAEVKSLVPQVTKPDGYAVLNADDPLVLAMRTKTLAHVVLVTRNHTHPDVMDHVSSGGWALIVRDGLIHWYHAGLVDIVASLSDIPVTFGGRAAHMVENALCATAAVLAFGMPLDQVRSGLASFAPDSKQNRGRLNVFEKQGVSVVIDYAHNEAGLVHLLALGRAFAGERGGRLFAVIGSAGDRTDEALHILGQTSAESADVTIVKRTNHYLRGRDAEEINRLIQEGVAMAGHPAARESAGELDGVKLALAQADRGDVVVVMSTEEYDDMEQFLTSDETTLDA
ncbi:MAG: Mur ligase family protein [Thermomicrobiales bacterium]